MNEALVIIDCPHLCYVERYGRSNLSYKGSSTHIIFGFLNHLLYLSQQFNTNRFAFCWDSPVSLRAKLYGEYKANRSKNGTLNAEEAADLKDFHRQKDLLKTLVLPQMGFRNNFEVDGLEADDVIAQLAFFSDTRLRKIVVSTDEDLFQLLDYCSMYNITKKALTSREIFQRTYGIAPLEWIQVKALSGCSSDNIRGIPGIGVKTAVKYITGTLSSGAAKKKIEEGGDIIQRNLELVRLPMKPLPKFTLYKEVFYSDDFFRVWDEYGFASFFKPDRFGRWKRNFRLKSRGQ